MSGPPLTIATLCASAADFADVESSRTEPSLYGTTDGKAVGTHLEHRFRAYLQSKFDFEPGNSARGIDFPVLGVDMKATSLRQPQSSSPFRSARQKVYGLGYGLLVFVYDKADDHASATARLTVRDVLFLDDERTGDYQTTRGLREILDRDGNRDDVLAYLEERRLPLDDIAAAALADEILRHPPHQGWLTISNALQWRLQFGHALRVAGVDRLR